MDTNLTIAIMGGTGQLGTGLATQWIKRGYRVLLGSRSPEKAREAAASLARLAEGLRVEGHGNREAAEAADVIVLAVPYSSHDSTLREIASAVEGKIVVDAVVPLVPPKVSVARIPLGGSAAQEAASVLGGKTRVVSAFHNVGAGKLLGDSPPECDVLVFGDDRDAKGLVIALVEAIGMRGVDGGVLANSVAAEALTSVLIGINRLYRAEGAGIRITGLPSRN